MFFLSFRSPFFRSFLPPFFVWLFLSFSPFFLSLSLSACFPASPVHTISVAWFLGWWCRAWWSRVAGSSLGPHWSLCPRPKQYLARRSRRSLGNKAGIDPPPPNEPTQHSLLLDLYLLKSGGGRKAALSAHSLPSVGLLIVLPGPRASSGMPGIGKILNVNPSFFHRFFLRRGQLQMHTNDFILFLAQEKFFIKSVPSAAGARLNHGVTAAVCSQTETPEFQIESLVLKLYHISWMVVFQNCFVCLLF